jgi:hypothetical protein
MAEAVAIRTFMKLKVLETIPVTGSITLHDLAKVTGAQESLLGTLEILICSSAEVYLYADWVLQSEWVVCLVRDYDFYMRCSQRELLPPTAIRHLALMTGN